MDPQEQLDLDAMAEAEAEFEFEQEQKAKLSGAMGRGMPKPPPYAGGSDAPLGADYSQSIPENFYKGVGDIPEGATEAGMGIYNFIQPLDSLAWDKGSSGPIDTIRNAGAEKTARTVGTLAGATAGGAYLGGLGATYGTAVLPGWGTAIGGIGGGIVGAGLGALGFNMVTDVAAGEPKQPEQYAKDFAYGLPLDTLLGGPFMAAPVKGAVGRSIERGATKKVLNYLDNADPDWSRKVNEALPEVGPVAGPFVENMSLPELLNNDVLKNQQRTLARASPEGYGKATEANRLRNDAHLKYISQLEQSSATPGEARAIIQKEIEAELAAKQTAADQAQAAVETQVAELRPTIDPIVAGADMRGSLGAGKASIRGQVTNKFGEIGTGVVDITPVQQTAKGLIAQYFKDVGPQPESKLASLEAGLNKQAESAGLIDPVTNAPFVRPATYTMQEVQALRSEALDAASGGDPRAASVAGQIAESLKASVEDAIKSGNVTPEEAKSWYEGIALRQKQGSIYESSANPNKKVLKKQPGNREFALPDSAVPAQYFRSGKGGREAMQAFKKGAGTGAVTLDSIHRYATDLFRAQAVDGNGLVNTKRARAWLDQHAEALKESPEILEQFKTAERAQTFLNERIGDLKRSESDVKKGALSLWLKNIEPAAAINEMLSGKDAPRKARATVDYLKSKDPTALEGLRIGVIEHLRNKVFEGNGQYSVAESSVPGGPTFDGKVRNAMLGIEWNKIKPALEKSKLLTDSQMKGFDFVYKDKASQMSVENARMPAGSDTVQNSTTLAALTKMAGNTFLRGYPTTRYIASVIEGAIRSVPQGKFLTMLEDALLNPKVARDLQNKATGKNITRAAELIFKDEIANALGRDATLGQNIGKAAKVAPFALTNSEGQDGAMAAPVAPAPRKPMFQRQSTVTSAKSFPTPEDLLNPPAPGELKNRTVTLPARDAYDSSGKKKVNFLGDDVVGTKEAEALIDADPYYAALYEAESSRNPNARPINKKTGLLESSAKGGFQLIDSTARSLGVKDAFDLEEALKGVKKLTEGHAKKFKTNDPAALYSLHYLGEDVYRKWRRGSALTSKQQGQVQHLKEKALPRFMRIYNKQLATKPELA